MSIIFIIGEVLLLLLALAFILYFLLKRSDKRWKSIIESAKTRIKELEVFESRFEQVSENVNRYMKGFNHLKGKLEEAELKLQEAEGKLEEAENNEEHLSKIKSLEDELSELQTKAEKVELLEEAVHSSEITIEDLKNQLEVSSEGADLTELITDIKTLKQQNEALKLQLEEQHTNDSNQASGDDKNRIVAEKFSDEGKITELPEEKFNGLMKSNIKELEKLRNVTSEQRHIIHDLRSQLALRDDGDKAILTNEQANQFEKMLNESEMCIRVLEDETNSLHKQLDGTNAMIMTMMKANGDQSNVINFARNILSCRTHQELADSIIENVKNYGLDSVLQLRGDSVIINHGNNGPPNAEEVLQLSDMSSEERYEENGAELLIRFKPVTLLIHNMPENDREQYTRFKESLAILLELAVDEVEKLDVHMEMIDEHEEVKKLLLSTHNVIQDIQGQFDNHAKESKEIMDSLSYVMENDAFLESIDPGVRQVFKDIMKDSKSRFTELSNKGFTVDNSFSEIMKKLDIKYKA